MEHPAHGRLQIDQNDVVFIQCLAQLVQLVDIVGGLDGKEIGLRDALG